jgi:hypothetical protein
VNRLRANRKAAGLTQVQLSQKANVSRPDEIEAINQALKPRWRGRHELRVNFCVQRRGEPSCIVSTACAEPKGQGRDAEGRGSVTKTATCCPGKRAPTHQWYLQPEHLEKSELRIDSTAEATRLITAEAPATVRRREIAADTKYI